MKGIKLLYDQNMFVKKLNVCSCPWTMKYRCLQDKAAIQVTRSLSFCRQIGATWQQALSPNVSWYGKAFCIPLDTSRVLHNHLICITFLCFAVTDYEYDVQCEQLTPPNHGYINASDSNNLYSKVTYTCDPGYKVEGKLTVIYLPIYLQF